MRDDYASMTSVKETRALNGCLEPGETKTSAFTVREDQLAFFEKREMGNRTRTFTVMAGKLSASVTLKPADIAG
jgi:hypothetical protein